MRPTIIIGAILLLLWLAYSVWPFFAVYRLASAVQARDVAAVNELVDFRALRGSLTAQIVRTYLRMTGKVGRSGSMLEQFAVGLGASVADPIVSKLVSPEALLDLLQNGPFKASAQTRLATFGGLIQIRNWVSRDSSSPYLLINSPRKASALDSA
jgi:Protein of unknown function (DUF2939)